MDSSRRAFLHFLLYTTGVLFTAGEEVVKRLQDLEGNTVTIYTGLTGVQSNAQILWFFQHIKTDIKIVESLVFRGETITDYTSDRFRDRLQMNRSSGSLTIRNISREDSGLYILQIITGRSVEWSFSLNVYGMVPSPYITRNPSHDPTSSGSRCSVLCSADHQRGMNLSWFKDREILNHIGDDSSSLILPLEVNDEEQNVYSCVTTNPVSNHTIKLNITEICSHNAGGFKVCSEVECVIRMVISALVMVVLIVLLIDHFKTTLRGRNTQTHKL